MKDAHNYVPPMLTVALPDNLNHINRMDEVLEDAFGDIPVIEDANLGLWDRIIWDPLKVTDRR